MDPYLGSLNVVDPGLGCLNVVDSDLGSLNVVDPGLGSLNVMDPDPLHRKCFPKIGFSKVLKIIPRKDFHLDYLIFSLLNFCSNHPIFYPKR